MEIQLTQGQIALIDDEDYSKVSVYKWWANWTKRTFYAKGYVEGKTIRLSHFILGVPSHVIVDHINGKTLDDRRENLRSVTNAQNCRNSGPRNGKKYKGVFELPSGRFAAKLWIAPKLKHLGVFDTMEEAALCVDKAVVDTFGEFVHTNFPQEKDNGY